MKTKTKRKRKNKPKRKSHWPGWHWTLRNLTIRRHCILKGQNASMNVMIIMVYHYDIISSTKDAALEMPVLISSNVSHYRITYLWWMSKVLFCIATGKATQSRCDNQQHHCTTSRCNAHENILAAAVPSAETLHELNCGYMRNKIILK